MAYDLTERFVVGISSRALFDLENENAIFEQAGIEAYSKYQIENEDVILRPGTAFPLVQAILRLNKFPADKPKAEVVIMSRNNAATSLRIFKSIEHYKLDITRSAWTGGSPLAPYIGSFKIDLFLSANEHDVQEAIKAGFAAGKIYQSERPLDPIQDKIRIAFDGDAVLFSDEAEKIYKADGLEAFLAHEKKNAAKRLPEGPFARLLKTISYIQSQFSLGEAPIITALVTARNSPAHERVIRTLSDWKVRIDQVFFMGGVEKQEVLKAFGAHIFFDDQDVHCARAASHVPTARVPYYEQINPEDVTLKEGVPLNEKIPDFPTFEEAPPEIPIDE